jgi:hypothetical protein
MKNHPNITLSLFCPPSHPSHNIYNLSCDEYILEAIVDVKDAEEDERERKIIEEKKNVGDVRKEGGKGVGYTNAILTHALWGERMKSFVTFFSFFYFYLFIYFILLM